MPGDESSLSAERLVAEQRGNQMVSINSAALASLIVAAFWSCACGGVAQEEDEALGEPAGARDELRRPAGQGRVIDLGSLDSTTDVDYSSAEGINDWGTVVGHSLSRVSTELIGLRAFRWKAHTGMVDLGTLGGSSSEAVAVNEREQVAGSARLADERDHAVVWDARNHIRDIDTFDSQVSSRAYAINNRGQVVGLADGRPFIWDAHTGMVDLELPGTGLGYPYDINDSGVVVGTWIQSTNRGVPFKWSKAEGLTELDLLGGTSGKAASINNRGEIVGFVVIDRQIVAVRWTAQGTARMASLPNRVEPMPHAINRGGLVVGDDTTDSELLAVQWASNDRVAPLPLGGPADSSAWDVNDCGEVVGSYATANTWHAYLWEPHTKRPPIVHSPERLIRRWEKNEPLRGAHRY
jgi:probable HAF family extracellular repeat protein